MKKFTVFLLKQLYLHRYGRIRIQIDTRTARLMTLGLMTKHLM